MGFHDEMREMGHHRRRDYEDFATGTDRDRPEEGYEHDEVGRASISMRRCAGRGLGAGSGEDGSGGVAVW